MPERRWVNPSLPQTLQIAVWLFYWGAFWDLITALDSAGAVGITTGRSGLATVLWFAAIPLYILSGYQIANTKKAGYALAQAVCFAPFVVRLVQSAGAAPVATALRYTLLPDSTIRGMIGLMFEGGLVLAVWHRQSKEHVRIWFD